MVLPLVFDQISRQELCKTNVLTVSPTRLQNDWIPLYYFVPVWDLQRNLGDYILHLVQLH